MVAELGNEDALLVVDVQNDFCEGGALPVPHGGEVAGVLNAWMEAASSAGATIVASRDWHPAAHISFQAQGGPWPPHCLQETHGAALHPELKLPDDAVLVSKGTAVDRDAYSPFEATDLTDRLRRAGVRRVWVGGLAQEVCVRASVLDACRAGFETHLIRSATRPIDLPPGENERSIDQMRQAGAAIEAKG